MSKNFNKKKIKTKFRFLSYARKLGLGLEKAGLVFSPSSLCSLIISWAYNSVISQQCTEELLSIYFLKGTISGALW